MIFFLATTVQDVRLQLMQENTDEAQGSLNPDDPDGDKESEWEGEIDLFELED